MAQYTHLNIYKTTYEFLVYYAHMFPHFQREFRYTIGEALLNHICDFILMIYKANSAKTNSERAEVLYIMQEQMELINVKLRLAQGVKSISIEKYNNCTKYTMEMEMQLSGWLSYTLTHKDKNND